MTDSRLVKTIGKVAFLGLLCKETQSQRKRDRGL